MSLFPVGSIPTGAHCLQLLQQCLDLTALFVREERLVFVRFL